MQLEFKQVKKYYQGRLALDIGRLVIPEHPVTAVVGPNGAGKSTLLQVAAGLLEAEEGEIWYDKSRRIPQKDVTMVFQQPYLLDTTVRRNIACPLKIRKWPSGEIRETVERLSRELGLEPLLDKRADRLSLGEAQKVSLARALSFCPKLLLLDEPCASIDSYTTQEIEKLLLKIRREGQTKILLVTHNLAQARRLADYVVLLHEGRVVEGQETEAFFESPGHPLAGKFIKGELLIE
ncbi:MAG: ATP-binding cassette domain-containing protein [Lachnospiraceae bacterium]|nr:ATP-binding cassette domain-containing protein [Lachnospiraceae bacterium]